MANKIIVPTGYMGSGSSAVTDLVSEIDGFDAAHGAFEYVFLHCPDGVFDLEDKLLRGNNALRSDEAIHRFLAYMEKLDGPGYWFTDYRHKISPDFMTFCREFVDELDPLRSDRTFWYFQDDIGSLSKRLRCYARYAVSLLHNGRHPDGKPIHPLDYPTLSMAFPAPEEFYAAARRFLEKVFAALGREDRHLILDQLLLPHNLFRLDDYFDEDLRVFVVERDPRDVFLLNKYFWLPAGVPVPCPVEAEEFCRYYARMRRVEAPADDPRILRLRFEDMVFRYDETEARICSFLDTDPAQHAARRMTGFVPERSANNTRLFEKRPDFEAEGRIIAELLPEYLYDFPREGGSWQESLVF